MSIRLSDGRYPQLSILRRSPSNAGQGRTGWFAALWDRSPVLPIAQNFRGNRHLFLVYFQPHVLLRRAGTLNVQWMLNSKRSPSLLVSIEAGLI